MRYYAHVGAGEASLLVHRRSIVRIVADEKADPHLRARLAGALEARRFASVHLGLPRNRSYTTYVDLGRPYATWNVFATPEFSVDPVTHCFPLAGCVAYLGFFDRARAGREAARLAAEGDDTAIEGAAAYSTLGWFADPILSSMLRWDDDTLAGVIFHELAHQRVYLAGDTAFDESFATFVEQEGLREWRSARGLPASDGERAAHDEAFTGLVLDLRERLRTLYARELDAPAERDAKAAEIAAFRERYARLRAGWRNDDRYDAWLARPINNARLVPFGLYDRWVTAFEALFAQSDRDWARFYARVEALAQLDSAGRARDLEALAASPADRK
ncbi:MAG TPA: aminopeptidase [Rhodanobacteraceae bacterium]|nr:aminopeptidase [Rhodanobacteraceae bacterium]